MNELDELLGKTATPRKRRESLAQGPRAFSFRTSPPPAREEKGHTGMARHVPAPHEQSFEWRTQRRAVNAGTDEESSEDFVLFRRAGGDFPWLDAGTVGEVLVPSEAGDELCWRDWHQERCWFEGAQFTETGKAAWKQKREKERNRSGDCIGKVAELLCLRLRPESGWRMLSANRVLHHSFGPGFTVATNGQEVILFDTPTLSASSWTITARQNIVGPVSGAEVEVEEWDYVKNKPVFIFPTSGHVSGERRDKKPRSARNGKTSRSSLAAALELLAGLEEGAGGMFGNDY